jgi:hypothetical protein
MNEAQRTASRKNGSKSKGPTSERGKNNSKFNALKTGLFSNRSVIPFLGERPEDFDNLERELLARFEPDDIVVRMLVHDCAVGWCRMKRLEQAAAFEVSNHCEQNKFADRGKARAVDSLKDRFYQVYKEKLVRFGPNLEFGNLAIEMDEVRSQLMMTSSGISFLIKTLQTARAQLSSPTNNPDGTLSLIAACTGIANKNLNTCFNILALCRKPTGGSQPSPLSDAEIKLDPATIELLEVLILGIEMSLVGERMIAETVEPYLAMLQVATAPLLPAEIANRISRAQADAQRNFYRPLQLLLFKESERG